MGSPAAGFPSATFICPSGTHLNAIEQWNITGSDIFAFALRIHDFKFNIVSRAAGSQVLSNRLPASCESGWKDTVYVPVGENVSVIATRLRFPNCGTLERKDAPLLPEDSRQPATQRQPPELVRRAKTETAREWRQRN